MPTVASLKQKFLAQISPGNEDEFLRLLTEADMRLLEYGRWRWTRSKITVAPQNGLIVLPADFASILGARVDKLPVDIRDDDYEFVPGGRGEVELGVGASRLIDQGLNEQEQRYYKVSGYLDEDDLVTLLVHFAPVALYDPELDNEGVPEDANAFTRCPDATALKLMMFGIIFEEAKDLASARSYIADALRGLDNKEQAQRGNAQRSISFRPNGPSVRRIRNLR